MAVFQIMIHRLLLLQLSICELLYRFSQETAFSSLCVVMFPSFLRANIVTDLHNARH